MPNRILREGILTSPRMVKLGWPDEVFYRRLMSVVDDFGRYFADAGLLRAACYPRQLNKVSDSDIGKWLQAIAAAGLVRVYPAQDGESYLELLDFKQQVRAKESKFPGPPSVCVADAQQVQSVDHLDVFVSVVEDVDDKRAAPVGDLFDFFWNEYPKKRAKDDAFKAFAKRKPDSVLLAQMLAAIKVQCRSDDWLKDGGKFIPYPATWLNDGRWMDEVATSITPPVAEDVAKTNSYLAKQAAHVSTAPPSSLVDIRTAILSRKFQA